MKKAFLPIILVVCGCTTSATASLLVYESYPTQGANAYQPDKSLTAPVNQNVPATSGGWTGPIVGSTSYFVSSTGLQYEGLATAGGSILSVPWATNTRPFSESNIKSTVYYSFLVNFTKFDDLMMVGLAGTGGSIVSGIRVGADGDLYARSTNAYSASGIALTLGTTYLIVGQVDFTDLGMSTSIWLNPNLNASDPGAANLIAAGAVSNGVAQWYSFLVPNGGAAPKYSFDEFRAGTTWVDVTPVPEPGTLALLALTSLGLSRRLWQKLRI